ncbi:MAG TPA: type II toxin-antitoxin system PemK/MazF family toxin [Xanthobacteraceae bacterium]|jgi:mRNA interferase MazF|nr:type II toxin-antitoxin system PemK/MazF family toxin [Xanthobacteraceae bacterium]
MTIPNDKDDIPDCGYLAWINFNPRAGREQSGNRPAVILSPYGYHAKTPYMIVCPITSNLTPYPFKVELPAGLPISGAVLVDQVKSVDRLARGCDIVGIVPEPVMADIRGRLASLLGMTGAPAPTAA